MTETSIQHFPPETASAAESAHSARLSPIAAAGLLLCIIAFWMLQHNYEGIVHDSLLYAFQALARLHPDSLGHDIYLRVGVQDRFTIFSPLAAALIHEVGLERAAAIWTFAAQIGFFACAWLLARSLMTAELALVSLGVLVMLPAGYGDRHVFSYVEAFMTPRLPAEVFALGAIAAALGRRYILCGAFLLVSISLHPLMAMAAVVLLFILLVGLHRPLLATVLAVSGLAALFVAACLSPVGPIARFSPGWWNMMYSRGDYLFPSRWPWLDWAHVIVPLATLAVGTLTIAQTHVRSLCLAALLTGLAGLALAAVGGDLLHIVLIVQGQPWRWLWLSNALAVILIPVIVGDCWRAGEPSRIAVVLLAAAWVCIDESYGPLIALLTVAAAAGAPRMKDPRLTRLLFYVACAILAIGLLVLVGFVVNVIRHLPRVSPDRTLFNTDYLLALRRWKPWESGGIVPAAVLLLAWCMARNRRRTVGAVVVLALGIGLCTAFAHYAWNAWTRVDYPDRIRANFTAWRSQMPPTAQVLWLGSPFPVWYLLERPSYWSVAQMAASVYSEEMARKLALRERILATQQSTGDPIEDLPLICKNHPQLDFFVAPVDMGPTPFGHITVDNTVGAGVVWLYRCADHRG